MMSPVMNRVSRTARSTQDVVERVNSAMSRGFRTSANSVDGLRQKISDLTKYRDGLRIGVDTTEIRRANQELNLLQSRLDRVDRSNNRQMGGRGGLLGGMGGIKGLAAGYGLYEAVGVGQDVLNSGMNIDKAEASFTYFTQNADKANRIIEQLKQYSNKYAMYNRGDLLESASMVSSTMGSDSVMKITNMVGKLAQGNSENYKGIITRLQQIKGTGYLQGDELMELLNRGVFGLQEEIAKFKGISLARFEKLKQAQGISYNDVESALLRMTSAGGKYDKILDVISKTTYGKWATIRNTVKSKAADIGKSTMGALSSSLDFVIRFMEKSAPIGAAFSRLGGAFKPLLNGIFKIATSFGLISTKGDGVSKTVDLISNVVNRLAWWLNVAGQGVLWVGNMFEKYPWLKYAVGFVVINNEISKINFAEKASQLAMFASRFISMPFSAIAGGFRTISAAMQLLWANPVGLIALGVLALGAAIYFAWQKSETFRRVTIQTWEGLKAVWGAAVAKFQEVYGKITAFMQMIQGVWNSVTNWIASKASKVWQYLSDKFGWVADSLSRGVDFIKDKFGSMFNWLLQKAKTIAVSVLDALTLGFGSKILNKFGIGFDNGKKIADSYETARKAQEKLDKKGGKKGGFLDSFFGGNIPTITGAVAGLGLGGDGAGKGKTPGITDTVNGSISKQVTINLNSKIADINNYFKGEDSGESMAKTISDAVLMELNRILMTGDRLAIE
jgi:hypothetical protein